MGVAPGTVGSGVLLVAGAHAEAKRCGQGLSTVARSGSISSLLAASTTDDMKSLELGKTLIPFVVGISAWTFSIASGNRSPEIMGPFSYVFVSLSLEPAAWNVPAMDRGWASRISALACKSKK